MDNRLYVGNLSYTMRDDSLQQQFAAFGHVASAKVMMDRDSGRSKGFGFVEMGSSAEAQAAIQGLHGREVGGRPLTVNVARPQAPRGESRGGYGGMRDRY
ncbi:RNA recognition motif domain-containing protein [Pseudorhodoferax sp.]|uniref:RNA recognition motif domain-containing protein n=1 Tax=Pseudorhodoferax sp. TaxID=1993553 RepID=UPI0039E3E257